VSARPAGQGTGVLALRVNATLRKGILAAARSRRIGAIAGKHGMRLGANRFVAGETFDEAAEVLARLNERGLYANTTLLGEDVLSEAEAQTPDSSPVAATGPQAIDRPDARALFSIPHTRANRPAPLYWRCASLRSRWQTRTIHSSPTS